MLLHTTSQNHINYQNSLAMYKYSKDGISVLTVLDKRKVKKWIISNQSTSHL